MLKRICLTIAFTAMSLIAAMAQPGLRPTPDKWADPTGSHAVVMETYESLPGYTVYRPSDMEALPDETLPVVIMMGPGSNPDGDSFRPFWTEVASYGYIVIAAGPPLPGNYMPPIFYLGMEDIQIALEWVFQEPTTCDRDLKAKADLKHVALMGQSCGGVQCLRSMDDERVSALVFWNSASLLMGNIDRTPHVYTYRDIYGDRDLKQLVMNVKVPIAYFVGDTDMARQPALNDFNDLKDVPVIYAVRQIPGDSHAGTFREKNGGAFAKAAVDFLQWQFRSDKTARSTFFKGRNFLGNDPEWIDVRTKNLK